MKKLQNPMWDEINPMLANTADMFSNGHLQIPLTPRRADGTRYPLGQWPSDETYSAAIHLWARRDPLVREYAWTITAPPTVEFVSQHSGHHIHDPMAGTGYWAYLLRQMGHRVTAADRAPGNNSQAIKSWLDMEKVDARASAYQAGPNATLLLSWPPYAPPIGYQTIRAFRGNRIVYIGEDEGGCCGTDEMFNELEKNWRAVDYHKPAQWEGIRDYVTVYKRVNRFGRK